MKRDNDLDHISKVIIYFSLQKKDELTLYSLDSL